MPPSLMISEVMDHEAISDIKYVELYNGTEDVVALKGWGIHRYSNGGSEPTEVALLGSVETSSAFVVCGGSGNIAFEAEYGFPADQYDSAINGNGNDVYALVNPLGDIVDVYGEIGVDGDGTDWDYKDRVTWRDAHVVGGRTEWHPSEWTNTPGPGNASPGVHPFEAVTAYTPPSALPASIESIQDGTTPPDTEVLVSGVVTATGPYGVYIQHPDGGPWSGLWAYMGSDWETLYGSVVAGDVVDVQGKVNEYFDLTEVDLTASSIPSVTLTGTADIPSPMVLSLETLLADPEPWESVLIRLDDVTVSSDLDEYGQWEITDEAGTLLIDDFLHMYTGSTAIGTGFESITGPLYYSYGDYKIVPDSDEAYVAIE